MLRISREEYRQRLQALQASIRRAGLDLFIVSAFDSIYYLTGAGFEPLERPFFLVVRPDQSPHLLVPMLDYEHLKKAQAILLRISIPIGTTRLQLGEVGQSGSRSTLAAFGRLELSRRFRKRLLTDFEPILSGSSHS